MRDALPGKILGSFQKTILTEPPHRPRWQRRRRGAQDLAERVHVVLGRLVEESKQLGGEHRLGFEQARDRKRPRHSFGKVVPPAHHEAG